MKIEISEEGIFNALRKEFDERMATARVHAVPIDWEIIFQNRVDWRAKFNARVLTAAKKEFLRGEKYTRGQAGYIRKLLECAAGIRKDVWYGESKPTVSIDWQYSYAKENRNSYPRQTQIACFLTNNKPTAELVAETTAAMVSLKFKYPKTNISAAVEKYALRDTHFLVGKAEFEEMSYKDTKKIERLLVSKISTKALLDFQAEYGIDKRETTMPWEPM